MIFLKAFPFSFAILWRYLLVLPIMVIALFVFAAVSVLFALIVGFVAPFLTVMFIVAFTLASAVIPVMVGMRVGLQGRGVRPRNSYFGLIMLAISYGFFEAFCVLVVISAGIALFVLVTPLTLSELMALTSVEEAEAYALLFDVSPALTLASLLIGGFLIVALRTALLVPFAGASVGQDPDGRLHTPFYGFGQGFWTMLALVIVSYVGGAMAMPLVILLLSPFGIGERLAARAAELGADTDIGFATFMNVFGADGAMVLGAGVVLFLWFFSLQCAGAALIFLRSKDEMKPVEQEQEVVAQKEPEPPMEQTDLLALMRSRMPTKND